MYLSKIELDLFLNHADGPRSTRQTKVSFHIFLYFATKISMNVQTFFFFITICLFKLSFAFDSSYCLHRKLILLLDVFFNRPANPGVFLRYVSILFLSGVGFFFCQVLDSFSVRCWILFLSGFGFIYVSEAIHASDIMTMAIFILPIDR